MKAPNKIYLEQTGEVTFNAMWFDKPTDKGFQHEYIRKDFLLEWAKRELEMRRNTGDDYFYPAIVVLGDLIDKLNSL